MRRMLAISAVGTWLVAAAVPADVISRRWAGKGTPASQPDTLKVIPGAEAIRLVFNLSGLPRGARVYRASLHCFTSRNMQPREPAEIYAVKKIGQKLEFAGEALKLEAPWYRSFDATEAVRGWAKNPAGNLGFAVVRLGGLIAARSYLQVCYEGKAGKLPPQVSGLKAVHRHGQTFLWWKEVPPYQPPADSVVWIDKFSERGSTTVKEPGKGWKGHRRVPAVTIATIRDMQGMAVKGTQLQRVRPVAEVLYRVYRHGSRITPGNLKDAELLAEVPALNAYDLNMKIISYRGEYHDAKEVGSSLIPTLPIADEQAVLPGEAIYVHNPPEAGKGYYAVTAVVDGTENASQIGQANSLTAAVAETPGPGQPVFRFLLEDRYRKTPERWYMLYAAPPLANLPFQPFRILMGVPEKMEPPYAMSISGYTSGYVSMFEWRPSDAMMTLRMQYHTPWGEDGGLCYSDGLGTLRSFRESRVGYFSERYIRHLIGWAMENWPVDRGRITGGPLHFAIRHPEATGPICPGNYTVDYDFKWGGMGGALPRYAGPQDLAITTDGKKAWDVLDVGWYLRNNVGRDIPFLLCWSGTGKDSGHTSEFGWQDDPRGWAALRDTRQTFCAFWSSGPSGELRSLIGKMRWDRSIPAFTNCSLDNNPGCGDPAHGDYYGQVNGYVFWQYEDVVDEEDRWEMTVFLIGAAPEATCTVDVTPRHCKSFKPKPGQKFKWTNTSLNDGRLIRSDTVTADRWSLVTIRQAAVSKGKNRIVISKP